MRIAVATFILCIACGLAVADDGGERTLLLRIHPTDVRWGEIAVTEGPKVEIRSDKKDAKGDPPAVRTLPFSLSIVCSRRARREDPSGDGRVAAERVDRVGAVYLAATVEGGREAWKEVVDRVSRRAETLTPDSFVEFATQFQGYLVGGDAPIPGTFTAIHCAALAGVSDKAGETKVEITPNSSQRASSTSPDARAWCAALSTTLEATPQADGLATRFELRSARSERLTMRSFPSTSRDPVPWPEGATLEYDKPPEGVGGGWNVSTRDEESSYEGWRPARSAGPEGTDTPHMVKTRSKPAALPLDDLERDATILRWAWTNVTMKLGLDPDPSMDAEVARLDVVGLFTAPHGPIDVDGYARAVAEDFAGSSELPSKELLVKHLRFRAEKLGTDTALLVVCDRAARSTTQYCVAQACSRLLNAEAFCEEVARRADLD